MQTFTKTVGFFSAIEQIQKRSGASPWTNKSIKRLLRKNLKNITRIENFQQKKLIKFSVNQGRKQKTY